MAQAQDTGTAGGGGETAPPATTPAATSSSSSSATAAETSNKPPPLGSVTELTTEWLSKALNTTISSFESKRIGTGQVSAVHRLTLQYGPDAANPGPATLIFKVPSEDEGSRHAGVLLGLYERETCFYAEVAPAIKGGAVSRCYYSSFDDVSGAFSIILSDAAPSTVGNELVGATLDQAKLAVRELGRLHGQAMRNAAFHESEWLNRQPPINQDMMQALCKEFLEIYKEQVLPEHALIAHQMTTVFDDMTLQWRKEGVVNGLIHGDYRLDNMLFGEEGAELPLTVVDWQTVTWGPFMSDFSYFLGSSMPTDVRRQHWEELLQIYYDALGTDPPVTMEQCKEGLRTQSFFGISMAIISPIMVERTERGDKMFLAMFERSCEMVKDLDAISTLPQVGGPRAALQPSEEEESLHPAKNEMHWQESFYFDFIDASQDLGGYIRLGIDPKNNRTWYTLLLCGPNRPTVAIVDFAAPVPKEDLRFQTSTFQASHAFQKPLDTFHVLVDGTARSYADPSELLQEKFETKGESQNVKLYLVWKTAGIPYKYRLTTRYEIPCLVSGTVSIGDETFFIKDTLGQRDHSWGSRDWWSMDWVWSAIHLNDSTRIHGLDLRVPNAPRLGMGYIQQPASASSQAAAEPPSTSKAENTVPVIETATAAPAETPAAKQEALATTDTTTATIAAAPDPPEQVLESATTNGSTTTTAVAIAEAEVASSSTFEPLPLTDTSADITTSSATASTTDISQLTIEEFSAVKSSESFTSTGLIATCDHVLEPQNLTISFEPRGHAPLRLTADDGRVDMFPRAWGKVTTKDGREGWAWMEWNRNNY